MANIKKIKEMLTTAIFEVFERAFFVFAEPVTEAGADYRMRATIRFNGPMTGAMQISLPEELAKKMAANMLSLDEGEATAPVMADCIKECLNMVCGSFVRKVDPDRVFNLTIPEFELISERPGNMEAPSDSSLCLVFNTEAGAFEVMMTAPGCL